MVEKGAKESTLKKRLDKIMKPVIKNKVQTFFYLTAFVLQFLLTFILGVMNSFWGEINGFLYVLLQNNWNYSSILFIIASISCVYSGVLLVLKIKSNQDEFLFSLPQILRIVIKTILPVLSFVFNMFILLLIVVAGEEHLNLILYILDFLLPIFFTFVVILLGVMTPRILSRIATLKNKYDSKEKTSKKGSYIQPLMINALIILLYLGIFLIPLGTPSSSLYNDPIPEKPLIIAHRGAAHITPENTLIAVQQAAVVGADGWEVDVRISIDGFFFLMHDTDLQRTTNVASVFPMRVDEDASSFTMAELQTLDAGSWFVDRDPVGTIKTGRVDVLIAETFRGAKIPLLDEILNYTVQNPHWVDIDMKKPPEDHPFAAQYEDLLLDKLLASNITDVMIKSASPKAENFTQLLSPGDYSIEEIRAIGAELIDEKYWVSTTKMEEYQTANMPIMVGVLDSPVRFSQVWLLGVHMVLTDAPDLFIDMLQPLRLMSRTTFVPVWISLSVLSDGGGFFFHNMILQRNKSLKKKT